MWIRIATIIALLCATAGAQAADPYAALKIYNGKWSVQSENAVKADQLENVCARTGRFYVCEQTANGKPGSLVTFLPEGAPGHYYTSPLNAEARPVGRSDLTISGGHWEYSSKDTDGANTTFYRTTNEVSTDGNTIHFAVQTSPDGKSWKTTFAGVETRVK